MPPIWIQSGLPIFEILEVPKNAEESIEQLGTKYKFWFHHPTLGRCLCKLGRPNTGEDWSEKVAAEFTEKVKSEGKPENMVGQIVDGMLKKHFAEIGRAHV